MIGFNRPYFTGKENDYILDAVRREKISGNGYYTQQCQAFIEKRYGILKVLLTTSCTDALEMAALLIDIKPGDEVIIPSYTFVSTANAFILRGANIMFADSAMDNPNIDVDRIESLITKKTKAIVVVHYAGFCCDMDQLMSLASKYNLYVIEDAAQAIESTYRGKPLGAIGHLGCFSFHETKNVISGEGGALLINDKSFVERAEIIWEKGTNRSAFFRGVVDKYSWIDIGSSFLPSEITAAFLFAQLEKIEEIQQKRQLIWRTYYEGLKELEKRKVISLPHVPNFCHHNAHMFYLVCKSQAERDSLLQFLSANGINAIFHYLSLHNSPYFATRYHGEKLIQSDHYASTLIRLPFFFDLKTDEVEFIVQTLVKFYDEKVS